MNAVTFFYVLWFEILLLSQGFSEQMSSLFINAKFENGISVTNVTSHTINDCLGSCKDLCSAIKYNVSTTECRLFAHVLLKWPIEANGDMNEKMYVKVRSK